MDTVHSHPSGRTFNKCGSVSEFPLCVKPVGCRASQVDRWMHLPNGQRSSPYPEGITSTAHTLRVWAAGPCAYRSPRLGQRTTSNTIDAFFLSIPLGPAAPHFTCVVCYPSPLRGSSIGVATGSRRAYQAIFHSDAILPPARPHRSRKVIVTCRIGDKSAIS